MTITREWLEKHNACDIDMEWFISTFPNGMEINPENIKKFDDYEEYLAWLLLQEVKVTRELLKNGANVHASDDCAIVCAAAHGRTKLCQLLLEYGANVYFGSGYPLEVALFYGHTKTAALLKEWMSFPCHSERGNHPMPNPCRSS